MLQQKARAPHRSALRHYVVSDAHISPQCRPPHLTVCYPRTGLPTGASASGRRSRPRVVPMGTQVRLQRPASDGSSGRSCRRTWRTRRGRRSWCRCGRRSPMPRDPDTLAGTMPSPSQASRLWMRWLRPRMRWAEQRPLRPPSATRLAATPPSMGSPPSSAPTRLFVLPRRSLLRRRHSSRHCRHNSRRRRHSSSRRHRSSSKRRRRRSSRWRHSRSGQRHPRSSKHCRDEHAAAFGSSLRDHRVLVEQCRRDGRRHRRFAWAA